LVHTISFSESVAVRIFSDSRPHVGKISELQKGLVLLCEGAEKVGEGAGFGFPVLAYSDDTYFSGDSRVTVSRGNDRWRVVKEFKMDRIPRNTFRNVRLENHKARTLLGHLSRMYQQRPRLRLLTFKKLTRKMHIKTDFMPTKTVGVVRVMYEIYQHDIYVSVDLRKVERNDLQKVFMLNEQGSKFFRRYVDSEGNELVDGKIGAWNEIPGEWASINFLDNRFGFRLWKQEDSVLRRGREYIKDSLDWVGLDYEVKPEKTIFDYRIDVLGA
jgi:hypothetical protein